MSFTYNGDSYMGTELMVRKLLAERLYLTKDELNGQYKPEKPHVDKIDWLVGMTIIIRLTVDKSVQAQAPKGIKIADGSRISYLMNNGDIRKKRTHKGHAFRVEIELKNIRSKKDRTDFLSLKVNLVNKNGALTKWHLSDATNWFKRAMPESKYKALIEITDGVEISNPWTEKRKYTIDREFFLVSGGQLIADAMALRDKAVTMDKYNGQRAAMYRLWAGNLTAAATFYDEVRTA